MQRDRRDFLWWVSAITAPLGIIGGPPAIADLLGGIIRWRGPLAYLAAYWDEHITQPFGQVINAALALAPFKVHAPEGVVDYIALGCLFFASQLRAANLLFPTVTLHERPSLGQLGVTALWAVVCFAFLAVPLLLCLVILLALWPGHVLIFALDRRVPRVERWLALAPFWLFLLLWGLNTWAPVTP